ncbi:MAG: hypothetical protein J6X78_04635 [Treponema sp.]|nr:hypothetical protein [Treponema sp.]
MILIIEFLILFIIFTLMVVPAVLKNPLSMVHDYPLDIYQKAIELGLVKESQNRKSKKFLVKRVIAIAVIGMLFGFVVYRFNGADNFLKGAGFTYLLWTVANWYDCFVIDWIWFCHSKRVIIPGTEGMRGYKDYLFHVKGSLKGMLLGIPASLVAGAFVAIIAK